MADWHYFDNNGQKQGPYSGTQILQLARQGTIKSETLVEAPDGRTGPAKDWLRKPAPVSQTPSSSPSVVANPFTAPMPTGENPFTGPMPSLNETMSKSVPVPKEKKEKGLLPYVVVAVAGIGIVLVAALAYCFQSGLFGKSTPPSLPGGQVAEGYLLQSDTPSESDNRKAEEERISEQKRKAEEERAVEQRRQAEAKRIDEQRRKAEEERMAEQRRQAEAKRIAELNQIKQDDMYRFDFVEETKPVPAVITNAVSIVDEINGRGLGALSTSSQLNTLTQYGTLSLRDKLKEAKTDSEISDLRDKIAEERAKIAEKTFSAEFAYKVTSYGGIGSRQCQITIPTEFNNLKSNGVEITCSDTPDVAAAFAPTKQTGSITLSVSGNIGSIREFVQNNRDYRVKVWFNNLQSTSDVESCKGYTLNADNSAEVLKIEIISTVPSRTEEMRGGYYY